MGISLGGVGRVLGRAADNVYLQGSTQLSGPETEMVLKIGRGLKLTADDATHLSQRNGLPAAAADPTQIIKSAPKNNAAALDDLLHNIKDAASARLSKLVLDWKHKNFPNKLDDVLDAQRGAVNKLEQLIFTKRSGIEETKMARGQLQKLVDGIKSELAAAPAAEKPAVQVRLSRAELNLSTVDEQIAVKEASLGEYMKQLKQQQENLKFSEANAMILKSKHRETRELEKLEPALQEQARKMIDISSDISSLDARLAQHDASVMAKLKALDDKIIGPGSAGAPSAPPATPPAA